MVSLFHTEAWGNMCWNVWVPLLVSYNSEEIVNKCYNREYIKNKFYKVEQSQLSPLVFLDKVKVIAPNNDCPHHLGTVASTSKDTTPNGDSTRERTFLINIRTWNDLLKLISSYILLKQNFKVVILISTIKTRTTLPT